VAIARSGAGGHQALCHPERPRGISCEGRSRVRYSRTRNSNSDAEELQLRSPRGRRGRGALLRHASRTEGVNGNGRKHRIGRIGPTTGQSAAQRALMERGTAPGTQWSHESFPFFRWPLHRGLCGPRSDPAVSVVSGFFWKHLRSGWRVEAVRLDGRRSNPPRRARELPFSSPQRSVRRSRGAGWEEQLPHAPRRSTCDDARPPRGSLTRPRRSARR